MKKNKGKGLIIFGILMIVAAFFLIAFNLYDDFRARLSAMQAMERLESSWGTGTEENEIPDYVLNPNMQMPVKTVKGIGYIGVLRIPTLKLELPIISRWSYPNLRIAPCRYKGSAYLDNFIICGHNYLSHFGKLKNLHEGDLITFTDMDGNVFHYKMIEREELPPTPIKSMESGDWDLTLFTCTVGGTSRVTIRCERVDNEVGSVQTPVRF